MKKVLLAFVIPIILYSQERDTTKFVEPLMIGNKWQYIQESRGEFLIYDTWINTIIKDSIIDNKKYFIYNNTSNPYRSIPYRYDYDSNKVYLYGHGAERQFIDFGTPDSFYFAMYNYYLQRYDNVQMHKSKAFIFLKWYNTINYSHGGERSYADGIGYYYGESYEPGPNGSRYYTTELVNALIYDSTGNYKYYTYGYGPTVYFNNFNIYNKDTIHINCNSEHEYDRRGYMLGQWKWFVNFTDSVWIEIFYAKNEDTTGHSKLLLKSIPNTLNYSGILNINRQLIQKGYDLYHRTVAKDKGIIPNYTYSIYYKADNTVIVNVEPNLKVDYSLEQNYPNPFNPITTIKYSIEKPSNVVIKIFDVLGNEVSKLVDEPKERGYYSVDFDAFKLASGIYYYSISAGEFYSVKKMVLLK